MYHILPKGYLLFLRNQLHEFSISAITLWVTFAICSYIYQLQKILNFIFCDIKNMLTTEIYILIFIVYAIFEIIAIILRPVLRIFHRLIASCEF